MKIPLDKNLNHIEIISLKSKPKQEEETKSEEFMPELKSEEIIFNEKIFDGKNSDQLEHIPLINFQPPAFGITILGSSHGFDPNGSTSGYIIWVNGKGIMVDPPPFMTYKLQKKGVPGCFIESVIISHCHADHDAGTF